MELDDENIVEKLEGIFMPRFRIERDLLEKDGGQFVHYTSAENTLSILKTQKLWLRNPSCMNDYMEISHGYQMLLRFFHNENYKNKFADALNSILEGMAKTIFEEFDGWWEKIKYDTFIASISAHSRDERQHGRLSMWRAYGKESGKAALVMNNPPKKARILA